MSRRPRPRRRMRLRVMAKDPDRRAAMRLVLSTIFTVELVETDTFDCVVVIEELDPQPVVHVMSGEMSYSQVCDYGDMRAVRRAVVCASRTLPKRTREILCRS